jgi:hypothetical protein
MKLKYLLLIIPIIIITSYIIVLGLRTSHIMSIEEFDTSTSQKDYKTMVDEARIVDENKIDDPITDANQPYSFNLYEKPPIVERTDENQYEYIIIASYKKILNRNPTVDELRMYLDQFKSGEINENLLKIYLLNSTEYVLNVKLQSNEINGDVEYSYAKDDLISIISRLYFNELKAEPPKGMLLPLRDIYMYLESNPYIFRALLVHENYAKFEAEILATKLLKKEYLSIIYDKYFNIYDLKLKANDIKKYDMLARETQQQQVSTLPSNPSFQGTALETATDPNIGAGSGAKFEDTISPTYIHAMKLPTSS